MAFGSYGPQMPGLLGEEKPRNFGEGFQQFTQNNPNMLLALGMGLLAHRQNATANPLGNVAATAINAGGIDRDIMKERRAEQKAQASLTASMRYLIDRGHNEEDVRRAAEMGPEVIGDMVRTEMAPKDAKEPPTTADITNFNFAKQNGFGGTFQDWLTQGEFGPAPTDDMRELEVINQGRVAEGQKPYRLDEWIETRTKAGAMSLPPEMGARIGLGDQFLQESEDIKAQIRNGAVDSVAERGQLAVGAGQPAKLWRRIETGRESLVRNLTGAGMSVSEAENQASRYQIGPTDSKETMLDKIEGLEADLKATRQGAIGAKTGGIPREPPSASGQLAPGSVEDGYRFKGGDPANPANWEKVS